MKISKEILYAVIVVILINLFAFAIAYNINIFVIDDLVLKRQVEAFLLGQQVNGGTEGTYPLIISEKLKFWKTIQLGILGVGFVSSISYLYYDLKKIDRVISKLFQDTTLSVVELKQNENEYNYQEIDSIKNQINEVIIISNNYIKNEKMIVKNLAHELKNPLQVINGYNDINLIQKDSKYSEKIQQEISYMNEMITNMLSEEQFLRIVEIDVVDLIKTLAERYLKVDVHYEEDGQIVVMSDLNRLEQVFIVMLSNINKYSNKEVLISISNNKLRFYNKKKKAIKGNEIGVKILELQLNLLKFNFEIIDNKDDYCTILYFGGSNE